MAQTTIVFSLLLIAQGMLGYFGSPEAEPSKTALIPAAFGAVLLVLGLIALNEKLRKHAMHAAAAVGLLGLLAAGGRGLAKIGSLFSDDPEINRRPIIMVLIMAAICLVFLLLCVKSFIAARRRQAAERDQTDAEAV